MTPAKIHPFAVGFVEFGAVISYNQREFSWSGPSGLLRRHSCRRFYSLLRATVHALLDTQVAQSPAHCAEDPVLD
jgi:hypothetical protein